MNGNKIKVLIFVFALVIAFGSRAAADVQIDPNPAPGLSGLDESTRFENNHGGSDYQLWDRTINGNMVSFVAPEGETLDPGDFFFVNVAFTGPIDLQNLSFEAQYTIDGDVLEAWTDSGSTGSDLYTGLTWVAANNQGNGDGIWGMPGFALGTLAWTGPESITDFEITFSGLPTTVPEPSTFLLLGAGLAGLGLLRRKFKS
jgi:hypothetical protein